MYGYRHQRSVVLRLVICAKRERCWHIAPGGVVLRAHHRSIASGQVRTPHPHHTKLTKQLWRAHSLALALRPCFFVRSCRHMYRRCIVTSA